MALKLHLKDPESTLKLGRILAAALAGMEKPPALLLQGDLGSGKTTLVRGLVGSLPGSEMAEVSSPSFNIVNLYPTTPPVAHFDLYRLEGLPPDDALFEHMEDTGTLTVVEWAQFLDKDLHPAEALLLVWSPTDSGRSLTLHSMGRTARDLLDSLAGTLAHFKEKPTGLQ
jgi:tRNA threonylcarbamoyladenosine biosynthesis protein TsaE